MEFDIVVIQQIAWRFLGFVSSVVGFICYAFSPSFHNLFGHWTLFKIILYSSLSSIFPVLTLFINKFPQFSRGFLLKAHVGFLALMLTSLYSFYEDRSNKQGEEDEKGRKHVLSIVSFGAFASMSIRLSKQIQPELDVGMSNFLLGCLIVAFMKMNIKIALGVSALFYILISTVRSYCDSQTGLPDEGDAEREIVVARNGQEEAEVMIVSESTIDMPSLVHQGQKELDTIHEVYEQTEDNDVEELEIWPKAYEGPTNFSSPL
ncbi:uncharacterized protein LOC129322400 [Prosopis cineraria]|uniref:uncharacterized protein LOC129322400 n=1 Tax=Prosopis cineraria TaxID=364024 RepID=UPI00240FB8A6|nr:uncharacterized protein LOC129322400 [Prosopis cineraria]